MPALHDAEQAANELTKDSITELKTVKAKTPILEKVVQCVLIYLGYNRPDWK